MREGVIFNMSLIDEALKKTQSSLHQQKTSIEYVTPPIPQAPQTPRMSPSAYPFKQTKIAHFEMPTINKYWLIGIASFMLFCTIGFETYAHFSAVKQRYANFYGAALSPLSFASQTPLTLNGTMKSSNASVALINGHLYHAGDTISHYQIKEIHYDHVTLQDPKTHQIRTLTSELTD